MKRSEASADPMTRTSLFVTIFNTFTPNQVKKLARNRERIRSKGIKMFPKVFIKEFTVNRQRVTNYCTSQRSRVVFNQYTMDTQKKCKNN